MKTFEIDYKIDKDDEIERCTICKKKFNMTKSPTGRYIGNKPVCGCCSEDNSILLDCIKINK